jgi:hypothetical protein
MVIDGCLGIAIRISKGLHFLATFLTLPLQHATYFIFKNDRLQNLEPAFEI